MFEQPSSTTNTTTSSGSGSDSNHYFELGPRNPINQAHPTSVIVPPRQHHHQIHQQQTDNSPLTPCTPYYPSNAYGLPLFFGTDFLQNGRGVLSPFTYTHTSSSSSSLPFHYFLDLLINIIILIAHSPLELQVSRHYIMTHQDVSWMFGANPYDDSYNFNYGYEEDFQPSDIPSPLTPNISSPLTPHPFGPIPAIPTNQIYNRTFTDFYSTAASSPMVQYSTVKKSSAGRKPKEEDNMEDDDDDKRLKRRQRNKEAAARCRQRRIDLMKELQDQVNDFKNSNDKKMAECNNIRNKLNSLKNYLETHDCKLSREERTHEINRLIIPPSTVPPSQPYLQHSLRVHPPRADSVPYSIRSGHSSSSSEQHSPVEDYKPSIDQLLLPPISCIQNIKDRNINSMPPPALPASTSAAGIHVITSIPVSHANSLHGRSENVFAEPERKIPKIELDQTLTSLTMPDDVERPSALPTLSRIVENQPITTPSRPFRLGGEYQNQTPQSTGNGLFGGPPGPFDLLSSNTGLTPSGQPTMNFVSTPTPIQPHPDADLRPL